MQQEINRLKVKTEKMATRCQVCHQSDFFDPKTETCLRCEQVEKALTTQPQIIRSLWSPRFALLNDNPNQRNRSNSCKEGLSTILAILYASTVLRFTINLFGETLFGFLLAMFISIGIPIIVLFLLYFRKQGFILLKQLFDSLEKQLNAYRNPETQTITTLFDKYPEENKAYRESPYNEPTITTLFGDNKKK
ncbi:MAG: hypothetical protein HY819_24465 [Acidobacteria bacterium]|nr:hypothetical protein [Acidobacteriota bacterium]